MGAPRPLLALCRAVLSRASPEFSPRADGAAGCPPPRAHVEQLYFFPCYPEEPETAHSDPIGVMDAETD